LQEARHGKVGVDAQVGHGGVHRATLEAGQHLDPAAVPPAQLVAAGLAHDDAHGGQAGGDVPGAQASHLFLDHGADVQGAGRGLAQLLDQAYGIDHGRQGALHVGGTPAPEVPVVDLAAKGWVGPLARVAGVHVVHVTIEHQGRASTAIQAAHGIAGLVDPGLVKAEASHLVPDEGRHVPFLAGPARRLQQLLGKGHQLGSVVLDHPPQFVLVHCRTLLS